MYPSANGIFRPLLPTHLPLHFCSNAEIFGGDQNVLQLDLRTAHSATTVTLGFMCVAI